MANLKLYLLTPSKGMIGRDVYQGAVVAAKNIHEARKIHPNGESKWSSTGTWVEDPTSVDVKLIGTALPETQAGVILSDFFGC
jgi:hypothetical protein